MPFDVLFVASDSQASCAYDPDLWSDLERKYAMTADEVRRLVFAQAPVWTEQGIPMSLPAAHYWFRGGRRFAFAPGELERIYASMRDQSTTRFGNGLYVAAHLLRRGLDVRVVNDLGIEEERFRRLAGEGPRVVAISSTFLESRERVEACARRVRSLLPEGCDIPVVVGGPLVQYSRMVREQAPHLMGHPQVRRTYFFAGEPPDPADPAITCAITDPRGEETLARLVHRIREGRPWEDLPNLVIPGADGRWRMNPTEPEHVEVDEEAVPWDRIPEHLLGREVAIRGSRGCPLRCRFCSFVVLHPDFERKNVEVLRAELRRLAERADTVRHVSFVDDNLFLTRQSVRQVTEMMARERFPFTWSGFIRVDSITPQNARLMKESGCNFVMLGVESGDVGMLKEMRKVQRPENVLRAIGLLSEVGISSLSTLVVGFPGETDETLARTIDLLNAYPDSGPTVHWFNCWVHTVIPLTPADRERERWDLEGILLDWRHRTMDVAGARRARETLLREVRYGGAYNGPYALETLEPFVERGPEGWRDMRRFFKLRHRIACLDFFGLDELDGADRTRTLDEIEEIVRRTPMETEARPEVEVEGDRGMVTVRGEERRADGGRACPTSELEEPGTSSR